ncbi:MAG: cyanophycinase [Gemmatimonadota bacterium]
MKLLALLLVAAPLSAQTATRPRLVIIGGGLSNQNRAVYEEIVRGRTGDGPICVFPTASAVENAGNSAIATITRYSGSTPVVGIPLTTATAKDADSPEIAARIRTCSGYFFIGGDQSRIVEVFKPAGRSTLALGAVLERYQQGAVVSGSSAGAGMMSDPMIAGGTSAAALQNGIRRDTGESRGVSIAPGIGFFKQAIVDQHFLARGRLARLIVATLSLPESRVGFGIDENTALVVGDSEAWVIGESSVILVDARNAARDTGSQGGTGIRFALLSSGDRYRLSDGQLTFDPTKRELPTVDVVPAQPEDLFARRSFQTWLTTIARSPKRTGTVNGGGYQLSFTPMPDFIVRGVSADSTKGLSAGPWKLDLRKSN